LYTNNIFDISGVATGHDDYQRAGVLTTEVVDQLIALLQTIF